MQRTATALLLLCLCAGSFVSGWLLHKALDNRPRYTFVEVDTSGYTLLDETTGRLLVLQSRDDKILVWYDIDMPNREFSEVTAQDVATGNRATSDFLQRK